MNIINKFLKIDDSHEFKPVLSEIEDSPVSPLGRFTFWIIVAIMDYCCNYDSYCFMVNYW